MDSILTSVKKMLGLTEDYEYFDSDIIMNINAVFMILCQLGVGPEDGFSIQDKTATWIDFLGEDEPLFEGVKTYVHQKVRLMFDTSTMTSATIEAANRVVSEFEWRLNVIAESKIQNGGN